MGNTDAICPTPEGRRSEADLPAPDQATCDVAGCGAPVAWIAPYGRSTREACDLHRAMIDTAREDLGVRAMNWREVARAVGVMAVPVLALLLGGCVETSSDGARMLFGVFLAFTIVLALALLWATRPLRDLPGAAEEPFELRVGEPTVGLDVGLRQPRSAPRVRSDDLHPLGELPHRGEYPALGLDGDRGDPQGEALVERGFGLRGRQVPHRPAEELAVVPEHGAPGRSRRGAEGRRPDAPHARLELGEGDGSRERAAVEPGSSTVEREAREDRLGVVLGLTAVDVVPDAADRVPHAEAPPGAVDVPEPALPPGLLGLLGWRHVGGRLPIRARESTRLGKPEARFNAISRDDAASRGTSWDVALAALLRRIDAVAGVLVTYLTPVVLIAAGWLVGVICERSGWVR